MEFKNILVVKLSAIGDVVHALPVSYALKERFPSARVTWVVEPPAYDLLTNNPYIDEILLFEKKKFKTIGGFLRNLPSFSSRLKQGGYDAALDLQGLGKSAAIAYLSRAKVRLGCCNMRELSDRVSEPVCGPHQNGHIVERYLDVARALGCEVKQVVFPIQVTAREAEIADKISIQAGLRPDTPYVVLAVGANWPNKRWPTAHYAALCDWLYNQQIVPVLVGNGAADEQLAAEIQEKAEIPAVDIVGRTTLKQLAHIVRHAKALVGGDTGTMHMAAGLKTPTVALMGPTDSNRNGPYGQRENAIEIEADCKYCWKRSCPIGRDCLAEISPERVLEKLAGMFAAEKQSAT